MYIGIPLECIIISFYWQILEFWFPVCERGSDGYIFYQSRSRSEVLLPTNNALDEYFVSSYACYCYFSSKWGKTRSLCSGITYTASCHASLCRKIIGIESDLIGFWIIIPVCCVIDARSSWKVPDTILAIEYIGSISNGNAWWGWAHSNTISIIFISFPTVYFITRKSEPICITNIHHSFQSFTGNSNSFYIFFRTVCKIDPWNDSTWHSSNSKSHNR